MPRTSSTPNRAKPSSSSPAVFQNPYSSVAAHPPASTPTFGQTLKEGLAFGTGSALAHRFLNPFPQGNPAPSEQKQERPCSKELNAFETCMKTKSSDDFCGNEQISYTQCLRLTNKTN